MIRRRIEGGREGDGLGLGSAIFFLVPFWLVCLVAIKVSYFGYGYSVCWLALATRTVTDREPLIVLFLYLNRGPSFSCISSFSIFFTFLILLSPLLLEILIKE